MKTFGAEPLTAPLGVVKCKDCGKPVLRTAIGEHAESCAKIRSGGKKGKGKVEIDDKKGKKRKADELDDPLPDDPTVSKKKKAAPKVTKGRVKGPIDLDRHCGVINDKGLQCSRSLTCKSHSMGAKRAVEGRSKKYDELLLEWNRANNPNFVEPVKRESKAERKARKEAEKAEKKRLELEAAAALGIDLNATQPPKKAAGATSGSGTKKTKKATGAATSTTTAAPAKTTSAIILDDDDMDDIDSEDEVDHLVNAVRIAQDRGVLGVPLAVPYDAGSWFVARRERVRTCRDLLAGCLMPQQRPGPPGVAPPVVASGRLA
ncbi:SCA7-domain-containing protein [Panus rudis PR-1116 ss-1]|nr:SCA7-domain-containing protein [Panus rudis PR-1116 ss-1]